MPTPVAVRLWADVKAKGRQMGCMCNINGEVVGRPDCAMSDAETSKVTLGEELEGWGDGAEGFTWFRTDEWRIARSAAGGVLAFVGAHAERCARTLKS